jgi:hypothetical protein
MLHTFVADNREAIIAKARQILTARPAPPASAREIDNGVPLFLSQLSDALESEMNGAPYSPDEISSAATRRGRNLLALGFTVSQVVHDYGDICQAVTQLALDHHATITTSEFRTLNACLDTAIAEAVTEHARITAESRSDDDLGQRARALIRAGNAINTALNGFEALQAGKVPMNGVTASLVTRSLSELGDLIRWMLAESKSAAEQSTPTQDLPADH